MFSKLVELVAAKTTDADEAAKAVFISFGRTGLPRKLLTDGSQNFIIGSPEAAVSASTDTKAMV